MWPWLSRNFVYRPISFYRGERALRYLAECRPRQWWPPEDLERYRLERLGELARHAAATVPYYRNIPGLRATDFGGADVADILSKFPVVDKQLVKSEGGAFVAENFPGRVYRITTGGSTGEPLTLVEEGRASGERRGSYYRFLEWWGIRPGDKQARFWGVPLDERARRRERLKDALMNRHRFSAFDVTPEAVSAFWKKMLRFRPSYVYGFASTILDFVEALGETGQDGRALGLKAAVLTAETVYDRQRSAISDFFGAPAVNEYGCGEVGIIAFECREGRMHLNADYIILEQVDGVAVITDLKGFAQPLIRYRLGDLIIEDDRGPCPCGCTFPTIKAVAGRETDRFDLGEGRYSHPQSLNYVFQDFKALGRGIARFKVIQNRDGGAVTVLIQPSAEWRDEYGDEISAVLRERLGYTGVIKVEVVPEIPRDPSGKLRYFVREH
ncbi:MAG: hypothetical protein PVH29_12895 [Candidatus Zixiibacteriota bacterium]|jgi:phenylacetate-CoA ligase